MKFFKNNRMQVKSDMGQEEIAHSLLGKPMRAYKVLCWGSI